MTAVYFFVVAMVKLQLDDQRTGFSIDDRYHLVWSSNKEG